MNSLLFGIILSALLSTMSLLIVLLRVSPLTAPEQALPALFLSVLLSVSTVSALLLYALWKYAPVHHWDSGKLLSIALRQGVFVGLATILIMLFFLLQLLNWWILLLICATFVLVEIALEH